MGFHGDEDGGGDHDDAEPRRRPDGFDAQDVLGGRQVQRGDVDAEGGEVARRRNGFDQGLIRKTDVVSERALPAWKTWNMTIVVRATVCAR